MTCYHPWDAWRKVGGGITTRRQSSTGISITLPCGQCLGCRMTRSEDWATRLHHEATQHEHRSFVTLTYRDEDLPDDYSVSKRTLQLFLKRLRKAVHAETGRLIRFFACGEYGDKNLRPHYHIALFGYDFPDARPWRKTPTGFVVTRSAFLEKHWPYGHSEIGELTLKSSRYVAGYIYKKVNGELAPMHYRRIHPLTGEVCQVTPEFITMSNKPGIGRSWYDEFSGDTFPSDFVTIEGQKRPVPRYYTKQLTEEQREGVSKARKLRAEKHADNNTPQRLAVREESQELKAAKLKRDLE